MTPEEFTKHISPMTDGVRAMIKSIGKLQYVHKWMQEYSDQKSKEKDDEIESLKDSNDRYKQDYSECQLLLKNQLEKSIKSKARIAELEKANEEILELFEGIGVPNINWIQNRLTELKSNKQHETNS